MRCERAEELFSEYCEGAVNDALRVPLEGHLAACGRCRDQVEELREVWKVLDAAPLVEAPAGFRAAVWQRIDESAAAGSGQTWAQKLFPDWKTAFGRRPLAWAAAALLLVVLAGAVVPGGYTRAGWGLVTRDQQSQFIAARPQIGAGGQIEIPITLMNGEGKVQSGAVPVQVRVLSGPVVLETGSSSFTFDGHSAAVLRLTAVPNAPSTDVLLEVRRLDGEQPSTQILTVPLPGR